MIMDRWKKTAQAAWEAILMRVKTLKEEGKTLQEIADMLGHGNRALVSEWLQGNRKAENASFSNFMNYLDGLGIDYREFFPPAPTIRRPGRSAPTEVVAGDDLPTIPVMGEAGAGNERELFEAVPDCFISVLPRYYRRDMITLKIAGDSMSPTISMGDYVGIIPFDGILHEGGIYLVDLPPFGRVVKRVRMGKDGEIILLSDNPSYGERVVPNEGYENIVLGQVCWIMQKCWEF